MTVDLLMLGLNSVGVIIVKGALILGLAVVLDKVLWPDVDFSDQIKKGNLAAAITFVGVLLAVAWGSALGR